jgi:hypothetical protein
MAHLAGNERSFVLSQSAQGKLAHDVRSVTVILIDFSGVTCSMEPMTCLSS